MNLISNGIKYNREKGSLAVSITDVGASWVVSVSDAGSTFRVGFSMRA